LKQKSRFLDQYADGTRSVLGVIPMQTCWRPLAAHLDLRFAQAGKLAGWQLSNWSVYKPVALWD
jgi:hypothetical protein